MSFAKNNSCLLEHCLEVFLSTLLGMEADSIVIGHLACPLFALGCGKIPFSFLNLFKRERIHRAPSPSQ
jgi:hypothetical protein